MIAYRVYEDGYNTEDVYAHTQEHGAYSSLQLAKDRLAEVWTNKQYPTHDIVKHELCWHVYDRTKGIVYSIIINPMLIRTTLITPANIQATLTK